jgi:hypothetical protein
MTFKGRVCVDLLPPLAVVNRVVMVGGIAISATETLVCAGNLQNSVRVYSRAKGQA